MKVAKENFKTETGKSMDLSRFKVCEAAQWLITCSEKLPTMPLRLSRSLAVGLALLTVGDPFLCDAQDNTPPTLISVGSLDGIAIGLCFSEPVDPTTASDIGNYMINGSLTPASVALRPDGASAVLTVNPPVAGTFIVTVNNVQDLAANIIDANSTATGIVLGYTALDIGNPSPAGAPFICNSDSVTVSVGGSDIWGNEDQFNFLYKQFTGDFDVQIRVTRLDYIGNAWSKAGLMVREDLTPGSRIYSALANPKAGQDRYEVHFRDVAEGLTAAWANDSLGVPYPNGWLRWQRQADTFNAYRGTDGINWEQIGQAVPTAPYPDTLFVGMATCAAQGNGGNTFGSTTAEYSFFAAPAPTIPANDNFADAISIPESALPYRVSQDTSLATT